MLGLLSLRRMIGCFVVPAGLFVGLMIATAGTAVWPPLSRIATPLICAGEIEYEAEHWSYRPGQQGISRSIHCVTGDAREDITLGAIGASFVVYSAIALAAFGLMLAWLRRRMARLTDEVRDGTRPADPTDLGTILAMVSDAAARGEARIVVRDVTLGSEGEDDPAGAEPAVRLARLKQLLDEGLITHEDYVTMTAEIVSGL